MGWEQNAAQLKKDWDANGYIVVRRFMDADEVSELRGEIDRYIADVLPTVPEHDVMYEDPDKPETMKRLGHMSSYDDYFKNLIRGGRFVDLAKLLLDDEVAPQYCQLFNKPARVGQPTPPHQDGFYIPLIPQNAMTMWLALNEADEENGCLRYLPGAHKRGVRPHQLTQIVGFSQGITDLGDEDRAAEVAVPAVPGDLLVHHWTMVHRADPNTSDRERWGLGSVFYGAHTKPDEEKQAAYKRDLEKAQRQWAERQAAS